MFKAFIQLKIKLNILNIPTDFSDLLLVVYNMWTFCNSFSQVGNEYSSFPDNTACLTIAFRANFFFQLLRENQK